MFAIETISFELCSCIAIQTTKFGLNILVKKMLSVFPSLRDPGSTTWRFPSVTDKVVNISSLLGLRSLNSWVMMKSQLSAPESPRMPCAFKIDYRATPVFWQAKCLSEPSHKVLQLRAWYDSFYHRNEISGHPNYKATNTCLPTFVQL